MNQTTIILNPAAGKGRGARMLPRIRRAFAAVGVTDIRLTSRAGEERELAARAVEEGARTVVAAGGDGTWSNVANAILAVGADTRLALLAAGTGNDFAKTVGAPAGDLEATVRLALDGPDELVDVGRIEDRYFINVLGFGFDCAVLEDMRRVTWLEGQLAYMYSAARQLFRYRGMDAAIHRNGTAAPAESHLMIVLANARNFGGTFQIAPGALVTDGAFDVIAIRNASALGRMRLFAAVTTGSHLRHSEVLSHRSSLVRLSFPEPPAYETDGEYRRAATADVVVHCMAGALRVVTPGLTGGDADRARKSASEDSARE